MLYCISSQKYRNFFINPEPGKVKIMETPPPYVNLPSAQPESRFLPAFPPPAQRWLVKIIIIAIALLLFQLPLYMIGEVSLERSKNLSQVETQIADSWGKSQELSIVSSADNVAVNAELSPEIRYRGIYHVLVYTAAMQLDFSYSKAPAGGKEYLTLSDMNGVQSAYAEINGEKIPLAVDGNNLVLPEKITANSKCRVILNFRGSQSVKFVPKTENSTITVSGAWGTPFFGGALLPVSRSVENNSFRAEWKFNKFTALKGNFAKVALLLPASPYLQCERLMKYATFFLIVFFCTMLFSEIITKTAVHPLQYIVAAAAPVLFYLMVLAFSEHIGFTAGYVVSAATAVLMVSCYFRMFLGRMLPALLSGVVFAASYLINFVILRMEDYSLLAGTIVLAILLAVIMVLTGKINRKDMP